MLLVDCGDMLAPVLDLQGELKGEVLARAYGLMRYDAVTLGETDLFYGPTYLGKMIADNGLPVTSINLGTTGALPGADFGRSEPSEGPTAGPGTSGPLNDLPPYVIVEKGGIKVAVAGMLNHRVILPKSVTDSIYVAPMEERLGRLLPEIERESDLIVALAHVGSVSRARALADSFPELDVIIASHVEPAPPPYYEQVGGTLLAYVRSQGRFMGRLNLLLDENRKVIGFGHEMAPMAPSLQDAPAVVGLLAEYIDRLKILVGSAAFRPTLENLYTSPTNYVTANACRECHEEQYEGWRVTPHAHAFETLESRDRGFDPECQRCHTTGFRYRTGFITPRGSPHFKHVQCEACHGPGGDHVRDPAAPAPGAGEGPGSAVKEPEEPPPAGEAGRSGGPEETAEGAKYGAITEEVCLRCHTPHNSPEFEYEKYLKKVVHEK